MEIRDIFSDVKDEDIKLPDFQREFKWKQNTMVKFINSLYNEYPTGTFYFWKTKDKNGKKLIIIVSNFVRKGILKGKEMSFKTLEISKFVQLRNMFNLLFEKRS